MGLDQYWFTRLDTPKTVTVTDTFSYDTDQEILHQHRKVPALQKFMQDYYMDTDNDVAVQVETKNGYELYNIPWEEREADFNCVALKITLPLLKALETTCIEDQLDVNASGFFWGNHDPLDVPDILVACAKARDAIQNGLEVFYEASY